MNRRNIAFCLLLFYINLFFLCGCENDMNSLSNPIENNPYYNHTNPIQFEKSYGRCDEKYETVWNSQNGDFSFMINNEKGVNGIGSYPGTFFYDNKEIGASMTVLIDNETNLQGAEIDIWENGYDKPFTWILHGNIVDAADNSFRIEIDYAPFDKYGYKVKDSIVFNKAEK